MLQILLILQLQQANFVTFSTIGCMNVKMREGLPAAPTTVHSPYSYGIRFEKVMGYILEEHFVTLSSGWH